jgi:hypothetical protein
VRPITTNAMMKAAAATIGREPYKQARHCVAHRRRPDAKL